MGKREKKEKVQKGKKEKEKKGKRERGKDKPSQQHLPSLAHPPLCPQKHAATSLKSLDQHLSVGKFSLIQTFLKYSFIHDFALLEKQPAEEQTLLLYHTVSGAI